MSSAEKPVVDFDHTSPEYASDPFGHYRAVRESCPVAWTESHGGYWVTSRYEDVFRISREDATFTSQKGDLEGVHCEGVTIPPSPMTMLPIEADPPEVRDYRAVMNPSFRPAAVDALRPVVAAITTWCIDRVVASGEIDLVEDLASPLPAMATMALVGLPLDGWEFFAIAFHDAVACPPGSAEQRRATEMLLEIGGRMFREVAERRREPRDDYITRLTQARFEGRALSDEEIVGMLHTTLGGGIDTTTALIANGLQYLDEHPEPRSRLATDPALMDSFCEEMLRFSSPVQAFARTARHDVELGGQTIRAGDRVLVSWAGANRDPDAFDRPDEVVIDRFPNRHLSFGVGSHRCIGANIARSEFVIAVGEVLRRLPDYHLVDGAIPYSSKGTVNGYHRLPARFTPGSPIGDGILPVVNDGAAGH